MANNEHPAWRPIEAAVLAGLAFVASVGALTWSIAHVAGRLFGDGAPPLVASDVPSVVANLPRHLADPRAAFPPSAARNNRNTTPPTASRRRV